MFQARLNNLRQLMEKQRLDSLVVTDLSNIFYLSGFTGSTAVLVVATSDVVILVDSRYTIQAGNQCPDARVVEFRGKSQMDAVGELLNSLKTGKTGFEADNISVASFRTLRHHTDAEISFRGVSGLIRQLRRIKDDTEIALSREAANITDKAMEYIVPKIVPGITEREIEIELMVGMRRLGADREGFDSIIAAGPNAACPHASPTDTVIQNNSFVKLDFGASYKHYNGDITRTISIGDPGDKFREIYAIVLGAQMAAIEAVKPGCTGKEIDHVARQYITSAGYGENFGHGLGHALGIEVHDGPGFSVSSDIIVEPGMILTVEPGIYIEEWGGIRIEDDILVTDTGCEILTHYPK